MYLYHHFIFIACILSGCMACPEIPATGTLTTTPDVCQSQLKYLHEAHQMVVSGLEKEIKRLNDELAAHHARNFWNGFFNGGQQQQRQWNW